MIIPYVCHRTDPKDNEAYQDFCASLGIEEEEEDEEQENSDDEVQEQRGKTLAMNMFCPLSGKPVSAQNLRPCLPLRAAPVHCQDCQFSMPQ